MKLDGELIAEMAEAMGDLDPLVPAHGRLTAPRWPLGVRRYAALVGELYRARESSILSTGRELSMDKEAEFAERLEDVWETLTSGEQAHVERVVEEIKKKAGEP